MKIKKLHIQNYKSLVNLEIIEPNPFTVFAGSNGAGKSNIFEALEYFNFTEKLKTTALPTILGNPKEILSYKATNNTIALEVFDHPLHGLRIDIKIDIENNYKIEQLNHSIVGDVKDYYNTTSTSLLLSENQSRIFVGNAKLLKINNNDSQKLNLDCSNLELVLKRLLKDINIKEEILSWLDLLIPGFDNIEIVSEPLSGTDSLVIYEKGTNKPFTKNLLSDGTWNILALLTAVYQSDEPQFLCIEEPENGLNPKVQKELVNLFRQKCEDEGHYIWLNTHSQTIVNQLTPKELILVDKVDGETKIKQLTDFDLHGLTMDEAWLTNSFGGGLPR